MIPELQHTISRLFTQTTFGIYVSNILRLPSDTNILVGEQLVEINSTYPADPKEKLILPLSVTFQPMSYMKMQVFASMAHGFEEAAKNVRFTKLMSAFLNNHRANLPESWTSSNAC